MDDKRRKKRLKELKRVGVEIVGRDVFVSDGATVESGARLCSPCYISGHTRVCSGAQVGAFSRLDNAYVGVNSIIFSSTLTNCRVGGSCRVGPYAYIRDGATIGEGCRVGDFVEVKRSTLGNGTKAAHLAYIGDAKIGARVNIGCGAVFANYDGKTKRTTIVEDECFIGCNSNIIAPSYIRKGAYIAAATTVCGEVEGGSLCVGRCRAEIKSGEGEGRYTPHG